MHRKVKQAHLALSHSPVAVTRETELQLEFANNSRVVILPGKEQTIRGYSGVALLVVDEAARVPDELYQSVRPMLAVSGGRLVLLSTPFGKRGFFHHEWTEGIGWERITVTASQIPRIPVDWLEQERRTIGDWWYRQEYMCEFVETADSVFAYDDVMDAVSSDIQPLFPVVAWSE